MWSIQFHVFLFMSICVLEILTLGGKHTNYDKGGVPASRSVTPRLVFIKFVLRGTTCEGRSPFIDPRLNFLHTMKRLYILYKITTNLNLLHYEKTFFFINTPALAVQ